jgi:hypothetical protein
LIISLNIQLGAWDVGFTNWAEPEFIPSDRAADCLSCHAVKNGFFGRTDVGCQRMRVSIDPVNGLINALHSRQHWERLITSTHRCWNNRKDRPKYLFANQRSVFTNAIQTQFNQTETHSARFRIGFTSVDQTAFAFSGVDQLLLPLKVSGGTYVARHVAVQQ